MDKRKTKAEATKKAIIDAAEQLFAAKGFAGTSISEMAKLAGVTKSLIHHHFGSKDALWEATTEKYRSKVEGYIDAAMAQAGSSWNSAFLYDVILKYFKRIEDHRNLYLMQTWLAAEGKSSLVEQTPGIDEIRASLRAAQREGSIRNDIPADYILLALWSLVESWGSFRRLFSSRLGIDLETEDATREYIDTVVKIFLDGGAPRRN